MLPSAVLTHLKAGVLAARGPAPVLIAVWVHPTSATAAKHARPSDRTWASGERGSGELADRDQAERFDRPQDDLIGFSVLRRADRRHERRLALGASSAWARTSAADVGVIHLDGAFQSLARV